VGLTTQVIGVDEQRGVGLENTHLDVPNSFFWDTLKDLSELRLDCGKIGGCSRKEKVDSLETYYGVMNDLKFPIGEFCCERYGTARTLRTEIEGETHLLYVLSLGILKGRKDFTKLLRETSNYLSEKEIPVV
jgi:hypothetical protein